MKQLWGISCAQHINFLRKPRDHGGCPGRRSPRLWFEFRRGQAGPSHVGAQTLILLVRPLSKQRIAYIMKLRRVKGRRRGQIIGLMHLSRVVKEGGKVILTEGPVVGGLTVSVRATPKVAQRLIINVPHGRVRHTGKSDTFAKTLLNLTLL